MLKSRFRIPDDDDEKEKPNAVAEDTEHGAEELAGEGHPGEDQAGEYQAGEYQAGEEHGFILPQGPVLPKYPVRRLNRSEVSVRLSHLGKTAEGDGYTYLKATVTNLQLTEISAIRSFYHLQFLDVSNNYLEQKALEAIEGLPFLVLIHADKNLVVSAALPRMKYLQVIIMNDNYLTSVHDVYQPELSTLEVGNNKIKEIHFETKMPTIRCLDFRHNLIQEIPELNFPILDSLYLAGNQIKSLEGVGNLDNLRILHVRGNPIKLLDGFSEYNKKIEYLNLRGCKVSTLIQVKKLKVLPSLQTLIMKSCPYMGGTGDDEGAGGEEDPALRIEMLATLPGLKRINKDAVSLEERKEAKELMMQWLEEGKEDEEEMPEEMGEEGNPDDD